MTDSERLEFLAGQVGGLLGFASAVIKSHPHLDALDAAFAETSLRQDSVTLPSSASEAFVQGHLEMQQRVKALFQSAYLARGR